jgi:phospholipid-transporting ATPase
LNEFRGKLTLINEEVHPLILSQILLRGAKLKNTRWIFGTIIYTGHDAKLLMNAKAAPLKRSVFQFDSFVNHLCRSNIDTLTNRRIIVFFIALVILALVSATGAEIYNVSNKAV